MEVVSCTHNSVTSATTVTVRFTLPVQDQDLLNVLPTPIIIQQHIKNITTLKNKNAVELSFISDHPIVRLVAVDKDNTLIVGHLDLDCVHTVALPRTNEMPIAVYVPLLKRALIHSGGIALRSQFFECLFKGIRRIRGAFNDSNNSNDAAWDLRGILLNLLMSNQLVRVDENTFHFFSMINGETPTHMTPERCTKMYYLVTDKGHCHHIGDGHYRVSDPDARLLVWADVRGSFGIPLAIAASHPPHHSLTVPILTSPNTQIEIPWLPFWFNHADKLEIFFKECVQLYPDA